MPFYKQRLAITPGRRPHRERDGKQTRILTQQASLMCPHFIETRTTSRYVSVNLVDTCTDKAHHLTLGIKGGVRGWEGLGEGRW